MEFSILGPLEVAEGDRGVALGGGKPRALLALLLLHVGEMVTSDRLIEELWGHTAPASAGKLVQLHVSRLRKAMGPGGRLVTRAGGYALELSDDDLDVRRFERLMREGRRALEADDARGAAQRLGEALALWRGPPLADFAYEPFAQAEIARLSELRLAAIEDRLEAELMLGRHAHLVGELERLVAEHPLRERFRGQLMRALYAGDRQAEALAVYRDGRRRLVDELGLEPSPALQDLERAILERRVSPARPAVSRDTGAGLPAPPNRTIGRARDVREVAGRLRSGSVRLLTLTGPGGVGKTRLALEAARTVAADFADGAHLVSLAAIRRPEDVPTAIVAALGIVGLPGESPERAIERFASAKQLLVVMDNFEHLLAVAPSLGGLLAFCPGLTVLTTSREPLGLHAEQRWPVSPLTPPEPEADADPAALAEVDAVALFLERARACDPGFRLSAANANAVAEICRRVDGLPLAVELAAARCGLLSPEEIAARLDTALGELGAGARDAPARQQTLRATVDWSHALLDEVERAGFARFSVFAGGATLDAAETVTGAGLETLERLVGKSLLVRRGPVGAPTRVSMLETMRAYAAERLATAADREAVQRRHHAHYLALARRHASEPALWGADRAQHLARLDHEAGNLDAALAWAVDRPGAEPALALCAALGEYWLTRDRYADAVRRADQALGLPGGDTHPALRVAVLSVKAQALWPLGRRIEMAEAMAEADAVARRLAEPVVLADVLRVRACLEAPAGRLDLAQRLADDALAVATAAGDDWAIAMGAYAQAFVASNAADLRERVHGAVARLEAVGNVFMLANLLAASAYVALCYGSDRDALEYLRRASADARGLESPFLWMLIRGNLALASLLTGDTSAARKAFREELELAGELVVLPGVGEALLGLAGVAAVRGDDASAARLRGAAATWIPPSPDQDLIEGRLDALTFAAARARYGVERWDAGVRAGAALSLAEAIADGRRG